MCKSDCVTNRGVVFWGQICSDSAAIHHFWWTSKTVSASWYVLYIRNSLTTLQHENIHGLPSECGF